MPNRMLAIQLRSAVGLCLVAGCSTSTSELGTKHAEPELTVTAYSSAGPAVLYDIPPAHASERNAEHVLLDQEDATARSAADAPNSSSRTMPATHATHLPSPTKIDTQGDLKMENPKANTTALQLQPLPAPGSQDGHAFDLAQMGIGAAGLAILYGGFVLVKRTSLERRRKRADEALQAEQRLLDVVRNAVSAQLQVHKKAEIQEPQQATDPAPAATTAPPIAQAPAEAATDNEPSTLQPASQPVPVPDTQPSIPVVTEVITPAADPRKNDPKYLAARRLLDALHKAERDVEPFLEIIRNAKAPDEQEKHEAARRVIVSWHQCIQRTRNSLQEAFTRHQLLDELPSTSAPDNLSEALARLYQHAAFFTSLLTVQKKPRSPILSWSKQLPGAALQLYWHTQTHLLAEDMQANPLPQLPESAPSGRAPLAPAPAPDNGDYQQLLSKAVGGGHGAK